MKDFLNLRKNLTIIWVGNHEGNIEATSRKYLAQYINPYIIKKFTKKQLGQKRKSNMYL